MRRQGPLDQSAHQRGVDRQLVVVQGTGHAREPIPAAGGRARRIRVDRIGAMVAESDPIGESVKQEN